MVMDKFLRAVANINGNKLVSHEQSNKVVRTETYFGPDRRRHVDLSNFAPRKWSREDLAFLGDVPLGIRMVRSGSHAASGMCSSNREFN
jgi:hypothetical protein